MTSSAKANADLRGAAFHEAGHAVVASALGLIVSRIEIGIGGDDAKGEADIQNAHGLPLVDQLAICAAGIEAQAIFAAPTHAGAGWGDYGQMIELLGDIDDETSEILRMAGHRKAYKLLKIQTEKVRRIADALLASHRIAGDELIALFN
ncbi:MAG: hypothetical protein U1E61_03575 [Bradyrhizobium sp.]